MSLGLAENEDSVDSAMTEADGVCWLPRAVETHPLFH